MKLEKQCLTAVEAFRILNESKEQKTNVFC